MKYKAGRLVNMLSNQIRRQFRLPVSEKELTGAQSNILHYILMEASNRDLFQKDIEIEFGMRPPTASELLRALERKGFIRREITEYDARLKKITITERALEIKAQVERDTEELEQRMQKDITKTDLEVFYRVMNQMLRNLEE